MLANVHTPPRGERGAFMSSSSSRMKRRPPASTLPEIRLGAGVREASFRPVTRCAHRPTRRQRLAGRLGPDVNPPEREFRSFRWRGAVISKQPSRIAYTSEPTQVEKLRPSFKGEVSEK